MTTSVAVYSYTHSVTYVADNILKSFKNIIWLSGLNPGKFAADWETNLRALKTWLDTGDLQKVVLEVFNPNTGALIIRWDIEVVYNWSSGDGSFWTDTEQLKYHIRKAGVAPADADYDILLHCKPGRPDVLGWGKGAYRSTDGFVKHSLGTTIEHSGLGGNAAYWRRAS
jgi:hypothetical protein